MKRSSTRQLVTLGVRKKGAHIIADTVMENPPRHIAFGVDTQAICAEKSIMLWPDEDDEPHVIYTGNSMANNVTFSADGSTLAASFEDGLIYVRNMKKKTHVTHALFKHRDNERQKIHIALSHNGSLLAINKELTLFMLDNDIAHAIVPCTCEQHTMFAEKLPPYGHLQFSSDARYLKTGQGIILDFNGPNLGRQHPIMRLFQ